ncbi:hypothetical protein GBAR_LOCUS14653 [Geodia barretti]|uniref:Uncharacterized protein n=1 Tax=Geodia barretti TaxID=519541 RepID=A0AA35S8D4_GEOBA|nr:hypothetical protein GBAR_LOCUS14653 [Geodia barretti]
MSASLETIFWDQCKGCCSAEDCQCKLDPLFPRTPSTHCEDILTKSGLSKASNLQKKLYVVAHKEVKLRKRRSRGKKSKKQGEEADVVSQLRARLLGKKR